MTTNSLTYQKVVHSRRMLVIGLAVILGIAVTTAANGPCDRASGFESDGGVLEIFRLPLFRIPRSVPLLMLFIQPALKGEINE